MATTNPRLSRFPTTTRNYTQEGRALTAATAPRTSPPPSQAPGPIRPPPSQAPGPVVQREARVSPGFVAPGSVSVPRKRPLPGEYQGLAVQRAARVSPGFVSPGSVSVPDERPLPAGYQPPQTRPTGEQWSGTGARTRAAAQGGTYYDPTSAWQTPLAGVVDVFDERRMQEDLQDRARRKAEIRAAKAEAEAQDRQRWYDKQRDQQAYEEARRAWGTSSGDARGYTEQQENADVGRTSREYGGADAGDLLPDYDATQAYGLRAGGPAPSGPLTGPFRPTIAPSPQQDFMSAYSAARRRAATEQSQMRDMESGGFREAEPKQSEAGAEQQAIITPEDIAPPEEYGPVGEATSQALYEDVGVEEQQGPQRRTGRGQFVAQAGGDPDLMAFYGSLFDQGIEIDSDGNMSYGDQDLGNISDEPATWLGIAGREYSRFLDRQRQKEAEQFIAEERARALPEVERVDVDPLIEAQQEKRALDQARAMRSMLAAGGASRLSPAAMVGTTAQFQQQANIEGQAVDAAMRWQAEVQNNQNAMAAWSAEVNRLNALLQVESDMRTRSFLAEEARRAQANQRAHEMELARLQNEVTGSDILGMGLQLIGTLGGAALGGFGGAIGGKLAASWLGDQLK